MSLADFNKLKAEARSYGIDPRGHKMDALTALVEPERAKRAEAKAKIDNDPENDGQIHDCSVCGAMEEYRDGQWVCLNNHAEPSTEDATEAEESIVEHDDNREGWLTRAAYLMRPMLAQVGAVYDPAKIRVSVGFGPRRKALGVCFPTKANNNGESHLFISPVEDDPIKVLATEVHELIHASDDCASGHANHFAKCARAIGLEGKLTATTAGEGLNHALKEIAVQLGPYPHSKLNLAGAKKQTTRMRKVECPDCGFTMRTTAKWLDKYDEFPCPCGSTMDVI